MQKIKIRLPATVVNFSPGLNSLGLALALYTTVEVSPRTDDILNVEPQGEGATKYNVPVSHPVVLALMRVFQRLERAQIGINVKIDNRIPIGGGLGAEAAFLVAGVIAANNLMGNVYTRDQALEIAAQISRADNAVTAMLGGLTASMLDSNNRLLYRTLPVTPLKVIVVLPEVEGYSRPPALDKIPVTAAQHNISRIPLFMEAMKAGNLKLLADTLNDAFHVPRLTAQIPAYAHVAEMAKRAGAVAVTVAGDGPALLMFAETKHDDIAAVTVQAFKNAGVTARSWVLPIDTQGIMVSMMGSV